MNNQYKLAVVNSHPIQYFAPLYSYLSKSPELTITAIYCSDFSLRGAIDPGFGRPVKWDVDLLTGYHSIFLGQAAKKRIPGGFWSLVCPQIWREIRGGKYDAVLLHGYSYAVNVLAFLAAKTKGIPVLLRSETHLGLQRSRWKLQLRDSVLAVIYKFVDGFLAIGTLNSEYYRSLGIPESKIFQVPYAVDNDRFTDSIKNKSDIRKSVRKKFDLPLDRPVVLYASKLTRRKHPDALIKAMAILRSEGCESALFLVGAGELEAELKNLTHSLGLDADVIFGGFINQAELPQIYAASDIFVLPSENEPWGLVVNEVMCAGLPIITSKGMGCVPDLVKNGINGYHVTAGSETEIAECLNRLLNNESLRDQMGLASLSIIKNWGYKQCMNGILGALRSLTAS